MNTYPPTTSELTTIHKDIQSMDRMANAFVAAGSVGGLGVVALEVIENIPGPEWLKTTGKVFGALLYVAGVGVGLAVSSATIRMQQDHGLSGER